MVCHQTRVSFEESREKLMCMRTQLAAASQANPQCINPIDLNHVLDVSLFHDCWFIIKAHSRSELQSSIEHAHLCLQVHYEMPEHWVLKRQVVGSSGCCFSLSDVYLDCNSQAMDVYNILLEKLRECRPEFLQAVYEHNERTQREVSSLTLGMEQLM